MFVRFFNYGLIVEIVRHGRGWTPVAVTESGYCELHWLCFRISIGKL